MRPKRLRENATFAQGPVQVRNSDLGIRDKKLNNSELRTPNSELFLSLEPRRVFQYPAKRGIKQLLSHLALGTGLLALIRWISGQNQERFAILMYHRVGPTGLPQEVFARQMRYVARHYRVLPLEELVRRHIHKEPMPRGAMAITFDDGYRDCLELAQPILASLGLPATVFPVVSGIEDAEPLWTNVVTTVCEHLPGNEVSIPLGSETRCYSWKADSQRHWVAEAIKEQLKRLDVESFERVLESLKAQYPDWRRLTWEQAPIVDLPGLLALRKSGWNVGAHTVTHPILSRLSSDQLRGEIEGSKRWLEEQLKQSVTLFCYPNGKPDDYNPAVVQVVEASGFSAACTAEEGWNDEATSRWQLKRLVTSEPSLAVFACELESLFSPLGCLRALRSGYLFSLAKLKRLVVRGGPDGLWRWIRERLWMDRVGIFMTLPLNRPLRIPRAKITCDYGWAMREDLKQLPNVFPSLNPGVIRKRYERGDRCWVGRREEKIITFLWVGRQAWDIWYFRGEIPLGPYQRYGYNAFTVSPARGLGVFPQCLEALRQALLEEGLTALLGAVDSRNSVSLRTLKRLGLFVSGSVSLRRRWGFMKRRILQITGAESLRHSNHSSLKPLLRHHLPVAVVLGQGRTGLGVNRLLGRLGIRVIGVDADGRALGFRSRYVTPQQISWGDTQTLLELCKNLRRRTDVKPVLIPTSDDTVRWLVRDWNTLLSAVHCLAPEPAVWDMLMDKKRCLEAAAVLGVHTPKTLRADEVLHGGNGQNIVYPCVLKPIDRRTISGLNGQKVFLPKALEEMRQMIGDVGSHPEQWVIQELIPGEDRSHGSCAVCLGPQGEVLGVFTSRKLRQYPPGYGIATICESTWESVLAEQTIRFLQGVGFRGVAEVEFKQDTQDGKWKLIEVNPRLWIQHPLAARCGVNLAYVLYLASLGLTPQPLPRQKEHVRWIAAELDWFSLRQTARQRRVNWQEWTEGFHGERETSLWQWDDPRPAIHRARELMSSKR